MLYGVEHLTLFNAQAAAANAILSTALIPLGPSFEHMDVLITGTTALPFTSVSYQAKMTDSSTIRTGFTTGSSGPMGLWCDFGDIGTDPASGISLRIGAARSVSLGGTVFHAYQQIGTAQPQFLLLRLVRDATVGTGTYTITANIYRRQMNSETALRDWTAGASVA